MTEDIVAFLGQPGHLQLLSIDVVCNLTVLPMIEQYMAQLKLSSVQKPEMVTYERNPGYWCRFESEDLRDVILLKRAEGVSFNRSDVPSTLRK